ncbi:MAG: hypothetical protein ACFBSD_02025 [Paracoccaceae bacterium]
MIKTVALPALVAFISVGIAAEASAWDRNGSVTGPRGTSTVQGSGSCSGGACARNVTKTGPAGHSATRQGSGSCSGGSCSGSRTTTGPRGQSATRSGTISR